jgi:FixJ family two-component response regulator
MEMARVAVVGHDLAFLQAASAILEVADGHVARSFNSGSSSLDDVLASRPDVLIVDRSDGERDADSGDDLKLRVMQAMATAPLILCTADDDSVAQQVSTVRQGPVFTLEKPVQAAELLLVLRHAANSLR